MLLGNKRRLIITALNPASEKIENIGIFYSDESNKQREVRFCPSENFLNRENFLGKLELDAQKDSIQLKTNGAADLLFGFKNETIREIHYNYGYGMGSDSNVWHITEAQWQEMKRFFR